MDNEFDQQASKILTENLEGLRWSEEYDIDEAPDITADLTSAEIGATYLFDDIDLLFPEAGTEQGVMDRLSDHGAWELKDNPYGAIVVKVGDVFDDQPDYEGDMESEDSEGWGSILKGAAISSLLGRGAASGAAAGAAYDALKDKPKKKKDKEDKGFTKGGW